MEARMMRRIATIGLVIATAGLSVALVAQAPQGAGRQGRAAAPSPYPVVQGKASRFEKIADGVYYGTGGGGGNSPVVVGDREALIVDTKTTPAAARLFLEDLKLVTNGKPVRWAVNSHYHYDHTDGNQVFRAAGIDVVGQEFVKYALENYDVLHRGPFSDGPGQSGIRRLDAAHKALADEQDPAKRRALETELAAAQQNWDDLQEIKPTPPNITYKDKKVIDLGGREVQLLFLGRGHTNGDTIVYLPRERVVCTGDLLESGISYMGDGQFDEWIATLENLKKLDFDVVLPGHGTPFKNGKAHITALQGYLRDVVKQVSDLRQQGVAATEAAQRVDLSAYKAEFPSTARPGAELRSVRHIYEWLYDREHRK
jgi:cyclase